ncbi:MAG: efflux RND transporter periplasmic adaptor subunit [Planctomycetota bacterium]|nr:efflux RND transporter periplasmic adaptor subunit [Planctomycetota bacterium]
MKVTQPRTGVFASGPCRSARGAGLVRVVGVSAAVLLVAAGGIWAASRGSSDGGSMSEASSLDMAKVETGSFSITTTAMGELEARNQIELRSELDTRADIVEIVAEGIVVKKGDVLIKLNTEQLQEQINQQTLEVERAFADVTAAENSLKIQLSENDSRDRAGQLKVELAELALAQWREGEVVKTRSKQTLEIEQAQRDLKRLKEKFERSRELLAEGFLSQDEHDTDEIRWIDAVARLETAELDKQTYEEYQFPRDEKTKISDVEEAKADLDRIRTQNTINAGAKESALTTTRRQYELKNERLEKLTEQVELATIVAPTDGLVVYATSIGRGRDMIMMGGDGPLQVGREVRPNEMLLILPDTSSMVASVRVHESLAGRVRPGLRVSLKIDAIEGETFMGVVESIGVLAESGGWRDPNRREYKVRIGLEHDNSDGVLKPSMRAEAEIMLGAVEESMIVPVQAVFTEGPVKYIYTPQGAKFARVPVRVGRMSDSSAEIISGLELGDRVLLREPDSGEVVTAAWDRTALEAVGVMVDEDGNPVQARRGRMDMMRAMQRSGEAAAAKSRPSGKPKSRASHTAGGAESSEDSAAKGARAAAENAVETAKEASTEPAEVVTTIEKSAEDTRGKSSQSQE